MFNIIRRSTLTCTNTTRQIIFDPLKPTQQQRVRKTEPNNRVFRECIIKKRIKLLIKVECGPASTPEVPMGSNKNISVCLFKMSKR